MKYDYDYSIGREAPDVIVQLWEHAEAARPYLQKYYRGAKLQGKCIYLREGSTRVIWESPELNESPATCKP
jgi:hypothetical protein